MKIVIFAPHPDDEIFACGGSILKWVKEEHDVHLVYVTDNRTLISWGQQENQLIQELAGDYLGLNEDQIAEIALKEANDVSRKLGLPESNVHFFKFHDQDAMNNIELGVKLSKEILFDVIRIVLPSDNNSHPDHQATHTMAKKAAEELYLKELEFYVYNMRGILEIPREKQIKVNIVKFRPRILELMKSYKTQLCIKETKMGVEMLKRRRTERFGIFSFNDINQFKNF
ncbi:MAG: PIG-L deacetylase family protein [Promethearchaeota archaeon]